MTEGVAGTIESARDEREALLLRLFNAHLKALVEIVEQTPATELTAPTLNAATKFLADNAVTHQTLKDKEAETAAGNAQSFGVVPLRPEDLAFT